MTLPVRLPLQFSRDPKENMKIEAGLMVDGRMKEMVTMIVRHRVLKHVRRGGSMELTIRCPKYHQEFWPDHKAEGVDDVDRATLSAVERSCKCCVYMRQAALWTRTHTALTTARHTAPKRPDKFL